MKRRTFLTSSSAALASLVCPNIGRTSSLSRAAIVIGVDKAGDLPVLNAAASGASNVASWLAREEFEVFTYIDRENISEQYTPVKIDPIFETVNSIADKGTYEQLVIYFSGHGFLNSYNEFWLLSGAPNNPNQAISLQECTRLCRRTGIDNVVFISDACRSLATTLAAESVRGSVIFPGKKNSGNIKTKVDIFLASQEGDPAFEIKEIDEAVDNFYGIYTTSFLNAFRNPLPEMVSEIEPGLEVILNRDLEEYLERDVNRRAQEKSIALSQRPVAEILSDKYIGRVERQRNGDSKPNLPPPEPTIAAVANLALEDIGFQDKVNDEWKTVWDPEELERSKEAEVFEESISKVLNAHPPVDFETQTGFSVNGAGITQVATNSDLMDYKLEPAGSPSVVQLMPLVDQPASIAIKFSNGNGTIIAGLPGYVAAIVVDDGRVTSVSYNRYGSGESEQLQELRALVSTSARFGVFSIKGTDDERQDNAAVLADRIRMGKSIDPTLGIYAAYAYEEADFLDKVASVREFMMYDLHSEIYDVAMLSGVLGNLKPNEYENNIVPFCPMLSKGWGLLRIGNIILPSVVEEARDYIEPALWTTFRPEGIDILIRALEDKLLH